MADYLVEHARANVWCVPRMDHQVVLQAKRVTAPDGAKGFANLMWGRIPMPESDARYHVFQIGQANPMLLGLLPLRRMWYRLSKAMTQNKLMADVYVNSGHQLPRHDTWVLVTEDRAILVAVREQTWLPSIRTESIFLRLYQNAFFGSVRSDDYDHRIEVVGHRYKDLNALLIFQQDYNNHRALRGLTTLYINGEATEYLDRTKIKAGDAVEFVYDSTVKQVLEFKLDGANVFESIKDLKRKYLLTHGGDQVGGTMIDYQDDIDVYIVRRSKVGTQNQFRGVYYHKNVDGALRMVTHRDYAIHAGYVAGYIEDNPWLGTVDDVLARVHIRHSGYARPLIFEHHRIHELYKLPFADRRMAMLGTESTVDVWKAEALENSEYVSVMDAYYGQVTRELAEPAYGYNGLAWIAGNTPIKVTTETGVRFAIMPYKLQFGATVYEFDAEGKLLGWFYWAGGARYHPFYAQTTLVEAVVGRAGYKIGTQFGQVTKPVLKAGVNYRFYIAPIDTNGARTDRWEDVTGNETRYVVLNGEVNWTVDPRFWATAVKGDDEILTYRLDMESQDGLLKFTVDGGGTYPNSPQGVAGIMPGKIDLYLNRKALIENLDYYVKWPEVMVVNKEYLNREDEQEIIVRVSGFCRPDMTREPVADFGWVRWGLLSKNRRYNLRDDRVLRMTVRGNTIHRDALVFSEEDSGVRLPEALNGSPYLIDEVVVPMADLVTQDFFDYRARSQVVDKQIEDYLTLKLPEPVEPNPNMIPNKYWLFSPFCSVLMHHLILDYFPMDRFRGQYSDRDVEQALGAYTYLLDFEPTRRNDLDPTLVSVHPHNKFTTTKMDIYKYNFLNRAIKVMLQDKVDITQFVEVDDPLA